MAGGRRGRTYGPRALRAPAPSSAAGGRERGRRQAAAWTSGGLARTAAAWTSGGLARARRHRRAAAASTSGGLDERPAWRERQRPGRPAWLF